MSTDPAAFPPREPHLVARVALAPVFSRLVNHDHSLLWLTSRGMNAWTIALPHIPLPKTALPKKSCRTYGSAAGLAASWAASASVSMPL